MSKYEIKEVKNKKEWEEFVFGAEVESFLQSWNWGESNIRVGKRVFRLGMHEGNKLKGVALVIKESAKRGPHFLIPGGPILDWTDTEVVNLLFKYLKNLAKKEGVWFIRVRPELTDNEKNSKIFRRLGFISSPMHLHAENTWVVGIDKSEDEILSDMRKTTRYLVRKSSKEGYDIEKTIDPAKTKILYDLQKETVERHKFVGFPEEIFRAQLETFGKDGQALLFVTRMGKLIMNAAIIIFYGKYAYYHHSASSEKSRVTNASYFLQWEAIKEAKARGSLYYNMWGIAKTDDPKHRFAGVTLFKKGFGGERIDWLHAHDLPISWKYNLTHAFESARKISRRL